MTLDEFSGGNALTTTSPTPPSDKMSVDSFSGGNALTPVNSPQDLKSGQQFQDVVPPTVNLTGDRNTDLNSFLDATKQEEKPIGLFHSLVQGAVHGLAKPLSAMNVGLQSAGALLAAGIDKLGGDSEAAKQALRIGVDESGKPLDLGYFGKIAPVGIKATGEPMSTGQTVLDAVGTGTEIASWLIGGPEAKTVAGGLLKPALGATIKAGIKTGAEIGALQGLGTGLQKQAQGGTTADTLTNTVLGTVLGGATGVLAPVIGRPFAAASDVLERIPRLLGAVSDAPTGALQRHFLNPGLGKIEAKTPEEILKAAQSGWIGLRKSLSDSYDAISNALFQKFTGARINLGSKLGDLLTKVNDEFGLEHIPQNTANVSLKESLSLYKDINELYGSARAKLAPQYAIVRQARNAVRDLLTSDTFGGKGGAVDKFLSNYSAERGALDAINSIINVGAKTPVTLTTAQNRLMSVFNEDKGAYLNALVDFEKRSGLNILDQIARSQTEKMLPETITKVGGIPTRKSLIERGLGLLTAPLTSPKGAAFLSELAGKASTYTQALDKGEVDLINKGVGAVQDWLKNPKIGMGIENVGNEDLKKSLEERMNAALTQGDVQTIKELRPIEKKLQSGEQLTESEMSKIQEPKKKVEIAPVYKGEKDLTTKVLQKLEGKSVTSKQEIADLTNIADLKQPERELIRSVLKDMPDKVPVKEFADKVKTELLPLKRSEPFTTKTNTSHSARYENISLPSELRGPVANYSEHIYRSPIKTSAGGVHFSENLEPNYFAHTRIEDLPKISEKGGGWVSKTKDAEGNWIKAKGDTRRVIELQSDLFQKGRLESEKMDIKSEPGQIAEDGKGNAVTVLLRGMNEVKVQVMSTGKTKWIPESDLRLISGQKGASSSRLAELSKLEPYRNTWHERIIREEVKQAAKDGKTKLQFPTGETAMKIEGLSGTSANWNHIRKDGYEPVTPESLTKGETITRYYNNDPSDNPEFWIVTDILGDGKFKAISEDYLHSSQGPSSWKTATEADKETFDTSREADTNNPIYRFYEKEVGRYLKNKYNAEQITDKQGVKWWQINVPKSAAKAPIEAFAAAPLLASQKKKNE